MGAEGALDGEIRALLYVWLGIKTPGASDEAFPPNHSLLFRIDESALPLAVRTLAHLAVDFLESEG